MRRIKIRHILLVVSSFASLLAGCASPPQVCGDFVMRGSMKMPPEIRALTSPDLTTATAPFCEEFFIRDLPVAIDPLSFSISGTVDSTNFKGKIRKGILEITAFDSSSREVLGSVIVRKPQAPSRPRNQKIKMTNNFVLSIKTKEAFNPQANLRIHYLVQLPKKPNNRMQATGFPPVPDS